MFAWKKRLTFVAALIVCVCFGGREGSAGTPRTRDEWRVYIDGEQRYGYEHTTVRRQDDGTFVYRVEARLLLDLLGQRQEISGKGTYVVSSKFEPVSLDAEGVTAAGARKAQGRVEGKQLVLVLEQGGQRRTRRIEMSTKPLLSVCLEDWLAGQPPKTTTAKCQLVDEDVLDPIAAVATLRRTDSTCTVWNVDLGADLGQSEWTFGPDGICRERVAGPMQMRTRLATAEEAKKISHRTLAGREILMFPVDKPIVAPDALTSLTVRLAWRDVPLDRFRLEDERQKIVRKSEKEGRCEAVVRIRPHLPADSGLPLPVKQDAYRPFLAETKFIKPNDPEIVRTARTWAGNEKTALGAVRALSNGVFKHMRGGTMIVETLPGPEVLRSRQGKCSEHAILLASLARSLGIPTRIVLGMRMVSGAWVGHMWNEAYTGQWVTVDTTVDEVGKTAALLKLIDSDTVQGTQPLRWAVAASLQVSIEDFEPRVSAVGASKTGIDGLVYTNSEFACRLTAPGKNWSLEDITKPGLAALNPRTIRFSLAGRKDVNIYFVPMSLPPAITPAILVEIRSSRIKTMVHEFKVLKNEDYCVHDMTGRLFVFCRAAGKNDPKVIRNTEVLWSDGTNFFLLNLIAPEPAHDEHAADFFKLLDSFESLRKPAPKALSPASAKAEG